MIAMCRLIGRWSLPVVGVLVVELGEGSWDMEYLFLPRARDHLECHDHCRCCCMDPLMMLL